MWRWFQCFHRAWELQHPIRITQPSVVTNFPKIPGDSKKLWEVSTMSSELQKFCQICWIISPQFFRSSHSNFSANFLNIFRIFGKSRKNLIFWRFLEPPEFLTTFKAAILKFPQPGLTRNSLFRRCYEDSEVRGNFKKHALSETIFLEIEGTTFSGGSNFERNCKFHARKIKRAKQKHSLVFLRGEST